MMHPELQDGILVYGHADEHDKWVSATVTCNLCGLRIPAAFPAMGLLVGLECSDCFGTMEPSDIPPELDRESWEST